MRQTNKDLKTVANAIVFGILITAISGCGSVKLPTFGASKTAAPADPEIVAAQKATASIVVPAAPAAAPGATQAAVPKTVALQQQPTKPADPLAKTLLVAATSARASKCGFYFQPAQLREGYIAHERSTGASEKRVAILTKLYDTANQRIASEIKPNENYCSKLRVEKTRLLLTKYIAGDFNYQVPKKKIVDYGDVGRPETKIPFNRSDAFGESFQR